MIENFKICENLWEISDETDDFYFMNCYNLELMGIFSCEPGFRKMACFPHQMASFKLKRPKCSKKIRFSQVVAVLARLYDRSGCRLIRTFKVFIFNLSKLTK